jgi:N-methylhydantoinase B
MKPGDVVRVSTPGGGGYGDPLKRDPAKVARDVMRGYYSKEEAEKLFGVRFAPGGSASRES